MNSLVTEMNPDAIVIGTGVSGSLIIDRLVREKHNILVLERGEDRPYAPAIRESRWSSGTSYAYENGRHVSRNSWFGMSGPESKDLQPSRQYDDLVSIENANRDFAFEYNMRVGYGGSGAVWSGRTWRFYDSDFSTRSRFGYGLDWPIDAETMRPFYDQAETMLGVSGVREGSWPFAQNFKYDAFEPTYLDSVVSQFFENDFIFFPTSNAAKNAHPLEGGCIGSKTCVRFCPSNALMRPYHHYLEPHRDAPNLKIEFDRIVSALEIDSSGHVSGINCKSRTGIPTRIEVPRGTMVFLCGNTIENLRIALNSARVSGKDFANSSGLLGKYFASHGAVVREIVSHKNLKPGRGRPSSYAGVTPDLGNDKAKLNSYMVEISNFHHRRGSSRPAFDKFREETQHWGRTLFDEASFLNRTTLVACVFELELRERNRVTLSSMKDEWGIPIARVDFELSKRDKRTFTRAQESLESGINHPDCEAINPWGHGMNGNHPIGGYVSATSASAGVTDQFGRSFDHPNLYFTGGGLFASTSCFNPTLTITANTLRMLDSQPLAG